MHPILFAGIKYGQSFYLYPSSDPDVVSCSVTRTKITKRAHGLLNCTGIINGEEFGIKISSQEKCYLE